MTDRRTPQSGTSWRDVVPAARVDDLVISDADDDVLVYDTRSHHIHRLNRAAAVVWRLCDGHRTLSTIERMGGAQLGQPLTAELIRDALSKLDRANLLGSPLPGGFSGPQHSRRAMVRKGALLGAALVGAEIVSITAPTATAAASTWVENCYLFQDERYIGQVCSIDHGQTFGTCQQTGQYWWTIICV